MPKDPLEPFRRKPSMLDTKEKESNDMADIKPEIISLLETFKEFINDAEKEHGVNYWATKTKIDQVLGKLNPEMQVDKVREQDLEPER